LCTQSREAAKIGSPGRTGNLAPPAGRPNLSMVPKPSPVLTHLWIELAALALVGAGFWLVPEDPGLPALLLTAIALPLMLLCWLVLWIAERPARRRRQAWPRGQLP
jgi:hypothetical protein